ncbi:MAG: sel1 repeat family protein [Planctomycetes bacterium]|nr:sel1 repeat family protein [Planctomycetota bacterium]
MKFDLGKRCFAVALAWDVAEPRLAVLTAGKDDAELCVRVFDIGPEAAVLARKFALDLGSATLLRAVWDAELRGSRLLVVTRFLCLVVDLAEERIAHRLLVERGLTRGGFVAGRPCIWLAPLTISDTVFWALWDFERDELRGWDLSRSEVGIYGRGVVIHPSGRVLAATYGEYSTGYRLYEVVTRGKLRGFEKPAAEFDAPEAYWPVASSDGKWLAIICAYWWQPHNVPRTESIEGTILVMDFFSGRIVTRLGSHAHWEEEGLGFGLRGRTIAWVAGASAFVHALPAGALLERIDFPCKVRRFRVHAELPWIAAIVGECVIVQRYSCAEWGASAAFSDSAVDLAERFVRESGAGRVEQGLPQDWGVRLPPAPKRRDVAAEFMQTLQAGSLGVCARKGTSGACPRCKRKLGWDGVFCDDCAYGYEEAAVAGNLVAQLRCAKGLWEGDPREALHWLETAARAGSVDAQTHLGIAQRFGIVLPEDAVEARKWFSRAVEQGGVEARYQWGVLLHDGIGGAVDTVAAEELWDAAARAGHIAAAVRLGDLLLGRPGTDRGRGFDLLERAAAAGDAHAHYLLGVAWRDSAGITSDPAKSAQHIEAAARRDHTDAMLVHARNLWSRVADPDPFGAIQWLRRAAATGSEEAARQLREIGALPWRVE